MVTADSVPAPHRRQGQGRQKQQAGRSGARPLPAQPRTRRPPRTRPSGDAGAFCPRARRKPAPARPGCSADGRGPRGLREPPAVLPRFLPRSLLSFSRWASRVFSSKTSAPRTTADHRTLKRKQQGLPAPPSRPSAHRCGQQFSRLLGGGGRQAKGTGRSRKARSRRPPPQRAQGSRQTNPLPGAVPWKESPRGTA